MGVDIVSSRDIMESYRFQIPRQVTHIMLRYSKPLQTTSKDLSAILRDNSQGHLPNLRKSLSIPLSQLELKYQRIVHDALQICKTS